MRGPCNLDKSDFLEKLIPSRDLKDEWELAELKRVGSVFYGMWKLFILAAAEK